MALAAHTIKPAPHAAKKSKRVGRGNASGKGTYSARGMKGQTARSGGKKGTMRIGFKQHLLKVPKLRGFKSPHAKPHTVALSTLNRTCENGDVVTPGYLTKKGIIESPMVGVKIVATGSLEKKITIEGCLASKTAVAAVEKAGGKIVF